MGAPAVITVPSKSYVAINSHKSDRSISPTVCDLGRVSNIAAAVTLPRTTNFANRNNIGQSLRSLPYKKRPISEVVNTSNSNSFNVPTASSETNVNVLSAHKKSRHNFESQSSTSALAAPSTKNNNHDKNHVNSSQVKRMKMNSTETSNMVPSQANSAENNMFNPSSCPQNIQRNLDTHLLPPQSSNSHSQKLSLKPAEVVSQQTTTHPHIQRNQYDRLHSSNPTDLPNQHNVQLPAPVMGKLSTQHTHFRTHSPSLPHLPNHQNVQLPTSGNVLLPAHHSLSMLLQQQNQQLLNENMQLQKQLNLFRQLMKNPQRLNQVLTRLEQKAH